MSKTKGFEVDFKFNDGKVISRHLHKLEDVKQMVERFKIPAVTIHGTSDKWTGTESDISNLSKWPIVPTQLNDRDGDVCPICQPRKEKK